MSDQSEARRLLEGGIKLVALKDYSKAPVGKHWNKHYVDTVSDDATGYGMPLAVNGLASIDPDDITLAAKGLKALGFKLEDLMHAGVRTESTRPGSGGRSAFKATSDLKWVTFTVKVKGANVTALEVRANSDNLQDVVPGVLYRQQKDDSGEVYTQRYTNGRTFLDAPPLPPAVLAWWTRMSTDPAFKREQRRLFALGCGGEPVLQECDSGGPLPFGSRCRAEYNKAHDVEDLLDRHGYVQHEEGRYAAPDATGSPGVRPIPGKEGLWRSDHASDPLRGTFDAWCACVILEHGGNVAHAEAVYGRAASDVFTKVSSGVVVRASEFMSRLEAPHWIFDKVIQRGYLYSLTARWGHAKTAVMLHAAMCAATGQDFGPHKGDAKRTRVLYLAGENPSDIRVRVALLLREFDIDIDASDLDDWLFFTQRSFTLTAEEQVTRVLADAHAEARDFGLVIVDTGAAHSDMDEENSNTEMLQFAKAVRRFLEALDGRPAVVCMMHPTKDASGLYDLQPRGGGAFAAEIDGELVLWKDEKSPRATLHHQPKFRGPGFKPLTFALEALSMDDLIDNFGQPTVSVIARPTEVVDEGQPERVPGGARQKAVWDALADIFSNAADHFEQIETNVRGVWGVPLDYLRLHTLKRVGLTLRDDEKGNYKRTIESMIDKGVYLAAESKNGVRYVCVAFTPQPLKA